MLPTYLPRLACLAKGITEFQAQCVYDVVAAICSRSSVFSRFRLVASPGPAAGGQSPRWLRIAWLALALPAGVSAAANAVPLPPAPEAAPAATPVLERLIELPPYLVEESANPPWRYARMRGIEVLSRCSDDLTRQLIDRQHVLHEELALLLPKPLQVQRAMPAVYVLYNDAIEPAVAQQITARMKQFAAVPLDTDPEDPDEAEAALAARVAAKIDVRFMPNYRLWDADSLAIFFVLDEIGGERVNLTLTPSYLRYLLEARTPALPTWFIEGMVELYGTVRLPAPALGSGNLGFGGRSTGLRPSALQGSLQPTAPAFEGAEPGMVTVRPAHWISEADTQALRKVPKTAPTMLPLGVLFASPRLGNDQAADLQLRRSQAALLIRWALDHTKRESKTGHPPENADLTPLEPRFLASQALWEFVDRSGLEPVTEALFEECFGQTYAEAEARLRDYLPFAVKNSFQLKPQAPIELPEFELRDATVAEVSRVRGDMARLEMEYVKEFYPQLTVNYLEQARRVTDRSLRQGDQDPRLLAVRGLAECASGNDDAARPFLEAAVAAKLPRARIYYELARIKFGDVRPTNPDVKLPPAKVADALALLAAGRKQAKPLAENYELIAEIWLRTSGQLSRAHLAVLEEGLRYFPGRWRLIYSTALLYGIAGLDGPARELVEQAIANSPNEIEKNRFLKLWSAIHEDWADDSAPVRGPETKTVTRWKGPKLKPEIVPKLPDEKEEPVVKLKEFKVSEVFPPINVRFNLKGENLFNTLEDPIEDARVTYVKSDGLGARMGIQVGDVLLALNRIELKGKTIREVALLVDEARKKGDMIWEIRRGLSTLTLRHKGKWEIPLPAVAGEEK